MPAPYLLRDERRVVDHVQKAYELLEPGGKLVSIMGESAFFQQQQKAKDFRKWLKEKDGFSEKLPANSFKNSERSTGVNTRLVVLEKPLEEKENYSKPKKTSRIVRFNKPSSVMLVLSSH